MTQIFNNRELSIIIWLILFFLFAFTKNGVPKSFGKLISVFFGEHVFSVVLIMIIYVELIILALALIGFWDLSLLKDTILWTAFVGFLLLMKTDKINSEKNYLKTIILDSFKGVIIIEFIANFYSFSLITELILIPK